MNRAARTGLIAILLGTSLLALGPAFAQETATGDEATAAAEPAATDQGADLANAASGILDGPALDELTSPIALYPDELLGQILVATTYPMDVVKADRFLLKNAGLADKELAAAVNKEDWADSVKSIAAGFPELIGRMSEHIDWTEAMGDALIVQTDDVLDSIQRLRAQAKLNGYLEDNAAMDVEADAESGDITISSADPEVIYVPQYTETVYTTPAPTTPYYVGDGDDWSDELATGAIIFGGALLIDAIFDDDWGNGWDNGYWHGEGGGGIDWDGDVNIDNGINIGNGNGNGNNIGNRPGLGDGERPAIGDRPENGDRPGLGSGGRLGDGSQDRIDKGRDANFRPSDANREAAREKVAKRQTEGRTAGTLPAAKSKGDRGVATKKPAAKPAAKSSPNFSKGTSRPKSTTAARPPSKAKTPTARKPAARAPAYKPSGGSRAGAASSRGNASRGGGGRSGGGRGGRRG